MRPDVVLGIGNTWARVEKGTFLQSRHIIALRMRFACVLRATRSRIDKTKRARTYRPSLGLSGRRLISDGHDHDGVVKAAAARR